jgi:hypothetical protein
VVARPRRRVLADLVEGSVVAVRIVMVERQATRAGVAGEPEYVIDDGMPQPGFVGMSAGRYCASWMIRSALAANRARSSTGVVGAPVDGTRCR